MRPAHQFHRISLQFVGPARSFDQLRVVVCFLALAFVGCVYFPVYNSIGRVFGCSGLRNSDTGSMSTLQRKKSPVTNTVRTDSGIITRKCPTISRHSDTHWSNFLQVEYRNNTHKLLNPKASPDWQQRAMVGWATSDMRGKRVQNI